jgi:GNAT superfamily N-acetyltransferase
MLSPLVHMRTCRRKTTYPGPRRSSLDEGEQPKEGGEKEKIPYPEGGNEEVWNGFLSANDEYEKRIMGDRKHWCTPPLPSCVSYLLAHLLPSGLLILVVDPAHHRRGIGKALVSDGIKRAHAQGLPLFVSASQTGKLLYKSLGFEVKYEPIITSANIQNTMMAKDFPLSQI